MRIRALLVGTVLSTFALVVPISVAAAGSPGTSITTSPVSSVLHVIPGQSVSTTISVQDNAAVPIGVQIQLQTFKPYGTNGRARVLPAQPNSAYMSWVHFSQTSFVAQPGVWQQIRMTISTPPTAALDYYYAVLVKPQSADTPIASKTTTNFKGYNAVLILLDATSATARPSISLSDFSANHGIYEYLPASFSITAHNTGNVFLAPAGDIYISRDPDFSNVINSISFNASQGNIIPGSARIYTTQWTNGFPLFTPKTIGGQPVTDSSGNTIDKLEWNFSQANKFRFGRYYAKMVLVYNTGTSDVPISAIVSFWVIPWKILSIATIFAVLVMIGLYAIGRRIAGRAFSKMGKSRKPRIEKE